MPDNMILYVEQKIRLVLKDYSEKPPLTRELLDQIEPLILPRLNHKMMKGLRKFIRDVYNEMEFP